MLALGLVVNRVFDLCRPFQHLRLVNELCKPLLGNDLHVFEKSQSHSRCESSGVRLYQGFWMEPECIRCFLHMAGDHGTNVVDSVDIVDLLDMVDLVDLMDVVDVVHLLDIADLVDLVGLVDIADIVVYLDLVDVVDLVRLVELVDLLDIVDLLDFVDLLDMVDLVDLVRLVAGTPEADGEDSALLILPVTGAPGPGWS